MSPLMQSTQNRGQVSGVSGAAAGAISNQLRPSTPFDELEKAVADVAMLANRIGELSDKMVGMQPPQPGTEISPRQPGLLGDIGARAENLRYAVAQASQALSRIEQQLP